MASLMNGHGFEQTPGDGEGQGSLRCCSPWGNKQSDTTEQLNNNNKGNLHSLSAWGLLRTKLSTVD